MQHAQLARSAPTTIDSMIEIAPLRRKTEANAHPTLQTRLEGKPEEIKNVPTVNKRQELEVHTSYLRLTTWRRT